MRQTTQARAKPHPADTSPDRSKTQNARIKDCLDEYWLDAVATVVDAKVEATAGQWLAKAKRDDEERGPMAVLEAIALASHLLLFEPSLLGATPIGRFIRQHREGASPEGRMALDALAKASFRLLRPKSRLSLERFLLEDLASGETLTLFDQDLPDGALGVALAVRIAPLPDGSFASFGPLTPLDAGALREALSFVRAGKGLSNPQRCAAGIYKHVVRHGGLRVAGVNCLSEDASDDFDAADFEDEFDDLDRLAFVLEAKKKNGQEASAEDLSDARRLTSHEYLMQALARSVISRNHRREVLADVFAQLALVMMETYARRGAVGAGGDENPIQTIAAAIDRAVAQRELPQEARALYEDLRRRLTISRSGGPAGGEKEAELARVLARIQGLRAKTVDQGCTEQEALASAKKVAELLDRYGLSLGEVEMREQSCEGVGVETGRKRRAPMDDCVSSIALFCDCKVWAETTAQGAIRYVFFGLPVDVEGAHYLYDLIDMAFSSETARYKREDTSICSTARRDGARSFQIGLAHGISEKLKIMKAERDAVMRCSTGRDLVLLKTSVIDEELEKLGLNFHARTNRSKRRIQLGAYEAGRAAGRKFEPRRGVEDDTAG